MLIPTLTNEKRAAGSNRDALEFVLWTARMALRKDQTHDHYHDHRSKFKPYN